MTYFFSSDASRTQILLEVAKIFLQLMAIGVLGAFAKWSFDEYNRHRDRAATLNEFRKDALRSLIGVTNQVRKVPLLIEAAQSARTYGEQMRGIVDSRHELSFIRHEIQTAGEAFSELTKIRGHIRTMESYLDGLIDEFKAEYRELSRVQTSKPEDVWRAIQELPKLKDLRKVDKDSEYYGEYLESYSTARDLMRGEIWSAAGVKSKQTVPPPNSWTPG
jgi:hypothetical protein